ncbi:MAG: hypothetical protein L3J35_01965 [Bacteroidales bacterium]|nr:hypothetical protein [Bacteroidales bacterium]
MKRILISALCITLLSAGCNTQQNMTYKYSDGSGNSYIIKKDKIEFLPVKKEFSSSGNYDMGDVVVKDISETDFENLAQIINKASDAKNEHIQNRIMTSGQIIIKSKGNATVYSFPEK